MAHRVTICGLDTSTLPKLKGKESSELMEKLKAGDMEAREKFINGKMRLVLSIVQRFRECRDNSDDLFQVGCVGLLKAIENFDTSVGVMFSTYAVPMIVGEIKRFMRDSTSIKVSRNLRDIAYKALDAKERLIRDGKEGAIFEISEELDMSEREIVEALDAVSEPVSIYSSICGEGEDALELVEQLYDKNSTEERWTESFSLKDSLKKITHRSQSKRRKSLSMQAR